MAPGVDYRQLQAPEQVRTDLPDNEAATRAAALGRVFREFEGVSADVLQSTQTQAGALAGAAAGDTGHPQYKQGFARLTTYGRAFNNAATGAYAVQAEAQADDSAARLRVQANNNPDTFRATYSAVRDAVLKTAPAEAVPMLTELYNKRLAAGLAAVAGDQATEQRTLQRQAYDEGVSRLTSRVAILQGSENVQDQLAAQDEHVKLSLLIDGGVNAGLYSKAEAESMHINAMRQITAQVFSTQVDRELAKPDGDVVTLLDNFRKAHIANASNPNEPPILSEPEFQKLMADATTKIREQNLLLAMNKREGKTAEQLRFEAGDQQYTSLLLSNQLTDKALDAAVRSGDLKPERATALHALMLGNTGRPTHTDAVSYARITRDPNFLDMSAEDLASHPGVSSTDLVNLVKEQDRRKAGWEGTQASKDAVRTITTELKLPTGAGAAMASDEQKKAAERAHNEYVQLMNDTDPARRDGAAMSVAQTVIKHAKQREAASDASMYEQGKQNYIKAHGPGSAEPAPDEAFKTKLQQYDDNIARSKAAAKGE